MRQKFSEGEKPSNSGKMFEDEIKSSRDEKRKGPEVMERGGGIEGEAKRRKDISIKELINEVSPVLRGELADRYPTTKWEISPYRDKGYEVKTEIVCDLSGGSSQETFKEFTHRVKLETALKALMYGFMHFPQTHIKDIVQCFLVRFDRTASEENKSKAVKDEDAIKEYLLTFNRPCTCGSGESWTVCHSNSNECG